MAEIGNLPPLVPTWPTKPIGERQKPPRRNPEQQDEKDEDRQDKDEGDNGKPHIDEYA